MKWLQRLDRRALQTPQLYSADNCKYISNPFPANSNRRSEEAHPPFSPRALPLGGHLQEQPAAPVVEERHTWPGAVLLHESGRTRGARQESRGASRLGACAGWLCMRDRLRVRRFLLGSTAS